MPDVQPDARLGQLKIARDAAQAVLDEISRIDTIDDPVPSHILARRPQKTRAQGDVDDLSQAIDDEEAATKVVTIDEGDVAELQALAARLDKAIVASALRSGGLATATTVINDVAKVRQTLDV